MFFLEREDLPNLLKQINDSLMKIEVKGESVEHLFKARLLLQEIYGSLKESKSKEEKD